MGSKGTFLTDVFQFIDSFFLLIILLNKLSLPKLPIPDLNLTLEKYLRCVKPILSDENYARTEHIVNEFSKIGGVGQNLQNILFKLAEEKENWVILLDYSMKKLPNFFELINLLLEL